ncbi:Protein FAM47E [Cricetulus griseus]|uniref:Protein FAM47E n=1 Tax=Cricetulus griseus TaxID=10029 RepID=G3ILH9_CRIGR|nr:Protein FAM47E [Cricetulus griseus]
MTVTRARYDLVLVTRKSDPCLVAGNQSEVSWWCYALRPWVCFTDKHTAMTQSIATTLGGPVGHNNQLANQHRASPPSLEGTPILSLYQENLPSKCFMKHTRLKFPRFMNSQHWVFVREGLDDFRKGCPPHQHPKGVLPHIHHRLPQATPEKRQNGLPKGAARSSKLSQARKAFLEDMEDNMALHPLALYPHLEEALPAELLLQVLEVLDPEKKLVDTWAYCRDTKKLLKEPTKLVEKCSSQVCLPKKMPVSHSDQWLCKEKPNKVNSLYKDSLLHDNVRRGVQDFCNWAKALGSLPIDEEFVLQQFDTDYQTRHSCDALHGRTRIQNPHKPKWVKMRYGAWYLKTNLWKKQRADEPLVDPKISHKAQDANFKNHLREQVRVYAKIWLSEAQMITTRLGT